MNLWWINLPYACAGVFVDGEDKVVQTAPIFSWMKGKSLSVVDRWVKNRKGEMLMVG